jgi:hypothetical protein
MICYIINVFYKPAIEEFFIKENMLIGNNDYKYNTITFVDNHDTDYLVSIFTFLCL